MLYRKEIDGLRALAVIPVILFHAGFPVFSGGFVGVDVFFVVSGYLITSLLAGELETGRFSVAGFYERRARRILPALFLVLLACLPVAWWLLLPHEWVDFGESLAAVAVFASNILFWLKTDYFAATTEQIPLLHTWSLAVEEQYYLLFPWFMLLFWRLGKRWLWVSVGVVAILSLLWSEWVWRHFQEANFYLLPSRAWELMLGALSSFYLHERPTRRGMVAEIAALLGLGMLGYAVFALDDGIPFPGLYALIPTVGTVLLIVFAHTETWVGKALSYPLLVGIGLISYSAYLWHQPLFVFARMQALEEPSLWLMGGLSLTSLLLAYCSWRFVEQPLRNRQRFTRRQIFAGALAGSLFFLLLGVWLTGGAGMGGRFAE